MTKVCKKCDLEKDESEFYKNKRNKDGLHSYCKICNAEKGRNWNQANKERVAEKQHNWNQANKEKMLAWHRIYDKEYKKKEREEDYLKRLTHNTRCRLNQSFANKGLTKTKKTECILGIDLEMYRKYLLDTFISNYNRPYDPATDKVHIDHIIPISTATTEEEVIKLCHYSNLQLLLAADNRKKSNNINISVR